LRAYCSPQLGPYRLKAVITFVFPAGSAEKQEALSISI
jgi:hypothetical protein